MRRLTEDIPGIGGAIRAEVDDFRVEEIPLYEPTGSGEHTVLDIEKRGISTRRAVELISRHFGRPPEAAGVAGLKDARAVTRQRISIPNVPPEAAAGLDLGEVRILAATRHDAKLRTGHLAGNRFTIRVSSPVPGALAIARQVVDVLAAKGVPNRFGPQRFGDRSDGDRLGEALVRGAWDEYLSILLGRPAAGDSPALGRSRTAYDAGDLRAALAALPGRRYDERRALGELLKRGGAERAVRAIPKRVRLFQISAFQSAMFNEVLELRIDRLDRVEAGDLAFKHDSGAVFLVEDAAAESPRAERFEISPSGPMFGYKMTAPRGVAGELEGRVIASRGLTLESFRMPGGLKAKGERRPLRVRLSDARVEQDGPDLVVSFMLQRGSYATTVLDEIMKLPGGVSPDATSGEA
jgi:tRNA pseudouridine13 synthase